MSRSGDIEFDTWLRHADQDLLEVVGSETDVESMLTNAKRRVRPSVAATNLRARAVGDRQSVGVEKAQRWSELSGPERAILADAGRVRTWQPREILALQGGPPSGMFVIVHGWVRIIAQTDRGNDVPLAVRGPAEIVGELAAISGLPRSATIQAIDEVHAIVIPRERLIAVLSEEPRIAEVLLRGAAIRLQQSDRSRVEVGSQDFPQRLAAVLLEFALSRAPNWEAAAEIELHVTQENLASFARVSRSSLIRGLDAMKKHGVVRTSRHKVTILRPDLLRDLASGRAMLEASSVTFAGL